jgi:hypothetical protein
VSTDWQMPRPANACAACARPFQVGQVLLAHLVETSTGYQRQDYCLTCAPAPGPQTVAVWHTRRPAAPPRPAHSFDRAAAYDVFQSLDAEDPNKLRLRFLLALLLWRKNTLRLTGRQTRNGREFWEFLHPASGRQYCIEHPVLPEDELDRLSNQLQQLLAGPPEQAEPTPAAQEKPHA